MMLIFYRIKWFFHCLFNLHRQMTVFTNVDTFVGCGDCNLLNDKQGNEYKFTNK